MEHEVHVPVLADRLRAALADPARVARAVPGLQQDAGTEPVAGRLKLRIGGHSITYRGAFRVTAGDADSFAVEGDAVEARGSGTVKFALTVRVRDTDGGTTVAFAGTVTADGRVGELPADAVHSAVTRLLDRCVENLAAQPSADPLQALATEDFAPGASADFEAGPDADDGPVPAPTPEPAPAPAPAPGEGTDAPDETVTGTDTGTGSDGTDTGADGPEDTADSDDSGSPGDSGTPEETGTPEAPDDDHVSVFDTDVPPPALDPASGPDPVGPAPEFPEPAEPPAEAAHARRTMIGRSAEEVDHAPPRGRYAPVPAPQTVGSGATLRWVAPAAALVVASAIVVGRVLRKRR
ncbi:SRPBCC domain-containing protein [Streptomyces mangrovisoli]|uniref:Carbon monoxide dehydrogenase n=1 Tax=Streptomyces mangrovisoli TaxID=1428628 RepID=A0A1J4P4Y5_9ACTN|nr:SRPBCC domain-containing protein [Streptomyces mangrovisoli]OIJ69632.1 hypothetical protein WN71_001785 [Streptomyces mangrovisoli]